MAGRKDAATLPRAGTDAGDTGTADYAGTAEDSGGMDSDIDGLGMSPGELADLQAMGTAAPPPPLGVQGGNRAANPIRVQGGNPLSAPLEEAMRAAAGLAPPKTPEQRANEQRTRQTIENTYPNAEVMPGEVTPPQAPQPPPLGIQRMGDGAAVEQPPFIMPRKKTTDSPMSRIMVGANPEDFARGNFADDNGILPELDPSRQGILSQGRAQGAPVAQSAPVAEVPAETEENRQARVLREQYFTRVYRHDIMLRTPRRFSDLAASSGVKREQLASEYAQEDAARLFRVMEKAGLSFKAVAKFDPAIMQEIIAEHNLYLLMPKPAVEPAQEAAA